MWIVQLALRRPYTFIVLAMLIVLMGVATILRMPADTSNDGSSKRRENLLAKHSEFNGYLYRAK